MDENKTILPVVPVLTEYHEFKKNITSVIIKLNKITELTEENKKEVKTVIAEMNKTKERISRYRIDETNKFLEYINPYIEQCKELEKLCTDGMAQIKTKVTELEESERKQKVETVHKLFDFCLESCPYRNLLKFEMFFEQSMGNKSASLTVIETQLKEWIEVRTSDFNFIKKNADDAEAIIAIYLQNGLKLTAAIETHQERYKSEAEIQAMIAVEQEPTQVLASKPSFEKKLDITVKIKQLPQSKVKALQAFLDGLGVEFEVEIA